MNCQFSRNLIKKHCVANQSQIQNTFNQININERINIEASAVRKPFRFRSNSLYYEAQILIFYYKLRIRLNWWLNSIRLFWLWPNCVVQWFSFGNHVCLQKQNATTIHYKWADETKIVFRISYNWSAMSWYCQQIKQTNIFIWA